MGSTEESTVKIIDPVAGALLRSWTHRPDVPLTDTMWESFPAIRYLESLELRWGGQLYAVVSGLNDEEPCAVNQSRPGEVPAMRTVVADDEGRIWIESRVSDGFEVDVFDRNGNLLGTAPMPDRDDRVAPYVRDNRLYVVSGVSEDVQFVDVYSVSID